MDVLWKHQAETGQQVSMCISAVFFKGFVTLASCLIDLGRLNYVIIAPDNDQCRIIIVEGQNLPLLSLFFWKRYFEHEEKVDEIG